MILLFACNLRLFSRILPAWMESLGVCHRFGCFGRGVFDALHVRLDLPMGGDDRGRRQRLAS